MSGNWLSQKVSTISDQRMYNSKRGYQEIQNILVSF